MDPNYFSNLLNEPNSPNTPTTRPEPSPPQYPFAPPQYPFAPPQYPFAPPQYPSYPNNEQGSSTFTSYPPYNQGTCYPPNYPSFSVPLSNDNTEGGEIPVFSTQQGLETINLSQNVSPKDKKKAFKWSKEEDQLLASAWLTVSVDSITGNNQQNKDFWRRIANYYNKFRKEFPERTSPLLKSHWYKVNPQVNDFNQCYIRLVNEHHSGWSDDQLMDNAHKLYLSTHNKRFNYEHVWEMVKDQPKWKGGSSADVSLKRTKTSESGSYTSESDARTNINVDVHEARPIGQKAAKRKLKEKAPEYAHIMSLTRDMRGTINAKDSKLEAITEGIEKLTNVISQGQIQKALDVIYKDTSGMTPEQLHKHNRHCEALRKRFNIDD